MKEKEFCGFGSSIKHICLQNIELQLHCFKFITISDDDDDETSYVVSARLYDSSSNNNNSAAGNEVDNTRIYIYALCWIVVVAL